MDELHAKKNLIIIDEYLQILRRAYEAVDRIKSKSINTQCHQRAITATTTMMGLSELINDFERGQERYMEMAGAKKVPIVIERKLKLVVNNTGGK
jgi:hypothetical protein